MPSSFRLFLATVQARTYPRFVWLFRSNAWMIQETVLPVLAVCSFAYAYRAMSAPEAYTGFLILGAAMTTFWLNVLWGMGAQLYWERDSGNLELPSAGVSVTVASKATSRKLITLTSTCCPSCSGAIPQQK